MVHKRNIFLRTLNSKSLQKSEEIARNSQICFVFITVRESYNLISAHYNSLLDLKIFLVVSYEHFPPKLNFCRKNKPLQKNFKVDIWYNTEIVMWRKRL